MFQSPDHRIELLAICGVLLLGFIQVLTKECNWPLLLGQNSPYASSGGITLHLEDLREAREC